MRNFSKRIGLDNFF